MRSIHLSPDRHFVAVSVILSGNNFQSANALIYSTDKQAVFHKRPKLLSYSGFEETKVHGMVSNRGGAFEKQDNESVYFTLLRFSADSTYIAGVTNNPLMGIVIYDWQKNLLVNTVKANCPQVTDVTFNPFDASRLCITGAQNMLRLWHYTHR